MQANVILAGINDCPETTFHELYAIFMNRSSLELIGAVWDGKLAEVIEHSMRETKDQLLSELKLQLFLRMLDFVKIRPQNLTDEKHRIVICQLLLERCGIENIEQLLHFAEAEMLHLLEEQWADLAGDVRIQMMTELSVEAIENESSWHRLLFLYERGMARSGYAFMRQFIQTLTRYAPTLQWPICFFSVLPEETRYEQTAQQFLAYRFSNKQMKQEMLPDLIVQLVLPYMFTERRDTSKEIEQRWHQITQLHTKLTQAINQLMYTHKEAQQQLETMGNTLYTYEKKIKLERAKQRQAWEQLVTQLMHTSNVPMYEPYTKRITQLREELVRLNTQNFMKPRTYSLAENAEMTSNRLKHHGKVAAIEQEIQAVFEQLADALLVSEITYDEMQQLFYELATKEIAHLQNEIRRIEEKVVEEQQHMKSIIPKIHQLENQRFELENTYSLLYTFSE